MINLGDMMARWTNDRWLATLHRVAVPPADAAGVRRQSIVFFHDPRADAVIECIPGCGEPRYEPSTSLELIQAKAAKALATAFRFRVNMFISSSLCSGALRTMRFALRVGVIYNYNTQSQTSPE